MWAKLLGMEEPDSTSWVELNTSEAARVLVADERRFLEPFMARERSVGEVARELGVAVDALAYRVRRYERLELLQKTREVPRKGRAVKYYRGAAAYRVPLSVLPLADLEELVRVLDAPMRERFFRGFAGLLEGAGLSGWAVHCYRDTSDRARLELAPPVEGWRPEDVLRPEVPALLFSWAPLTLGAAQAKELQAELWALLQRYYGNADAPTHLVGLFLAPYRGGD